MRSARALCYGAILKMRLFDLKEFSSTQYLYSFWYLQIHTFQAQFQVDSFISFVLRGRKQVEQNKWIFECWPWCWALAEPTHTITPRQQLPMMNVIWPACKQQLTIHTKPIISWIKCAWLSVVQSHLNLHLWLDLRY